MEKVFVPDATNLCTIKHMQQDLFFDCVFGNHRHSRSEDNAMTARTYAEEKHVRDKVVGGINWNKSGSQPGRPSVYQPTSAKFASRISCSHWQKF